MPHEVLRIQPTRRVIDLESDFFVSGNFERHKAFVHRMQSRIAHINDTGYLDECDMLLVSTNQITCVEVGCNQMFSSLKKFEEHKFKCHSHQCSICGKSFAADRLMSLHISELHDSYFAVASKRKPSFCCLVNNCEQLFWNDAERREHLIGQHLFHPSYDFHNPKKFLKKLKKHGAESIKSPAKQTPTAAKPPSVTSSQVPTAVHGAAAGGNRAQRRAAKFNADRVGSVNSNEVDCSMEIESVPTIERNSQLSPQKQTAQNIYSHNDINDSMDVDNDIDEITSSLQATKIHVPSKISFGRRKGHH